MLNSCTLGFSSGWTVGCESFKLSGVGFESIFGMGSVHRGDREMLRLSVDTIFRG
jgi:hypothetical protein